MRVLRLAASVLAALTLCTACAGSDSRQAVKQPRAPACLRTLGSATQVTYRVGRHAMAKGWLLGHGTTGVLLSNESDKGLCSWLPLVRSLVAAGKRVLVHDWQTQFPALETVAAARTLGRSADRVILVGASEGAKASLIAAAAVSPAGVVSLSAERFLGSTDVKRVVPRLSTPVLFVMAKDDSEAKYDTPELFRATPRPSRRLVVLGGAAHGVDLLVGPTARRVRTLILDFAR